MLVETCSWRTPQPIEFGESTRELEQLTRSPGTVNAATTTPALATTGTHLLVLATDPAAAADLPAWCRIRGHQVQALTTDPDGAIQAHLILGP